MVRGREWPFYYSQNLGLNTGNFGTDFGLSQTDLWTGNGPCMLLLYVISCGLNNMQIACCWGDALDSS